MVGGGRDVQKKLVVVLCVYQIMDARGNQVLRAREKRKSCLSALQTSQVHPNLDTRTAKA